MPQRGRERSRRRRPSRRPTNPRSNGRHRALRWTPWVQRSPEISRSKPCDLRPSLDPEMVPEPKPLKGDRVGVVIALRLSGVTAIAALIAWVVVTQPGMRQPTGNDSPRTAVLPHPGDGKQDQMLTATVRPPMSDRRAQVNEPAPDGGPEERPSGVGIVVAGPVSGAIPPVTASSSTESSKTELQSERTTSRPDDEETSALIKLSQDFLKNRDFSSARLLLRRVAEAGNAAAALSLGETFDPLIIQRLGAIGVQPDAAKAREWYERAAQLGSDVASQHLAKLAEHLPVGVTDDEAGVRLLDRPGRREAAGGHRGLAILPMLAGASRDQRTSMARSRWRGR